MSFTSRPGGVRVVSPAPRGMWRSLVARDEDSLVTQTPGWLDALCAARPFEDASRLYRFDDGTPAVLPMVRRRGWPARLLAEESWPGWGVGGIVGLDGTPDDGKARLVLDDLARRPALRVSVRFNPRTPAAWAPAVPAGFREVERTTYLLDLTGGFRTVEDRRFHTRVRRNVRRAEHAAVEVEVGRGGQLIPEFRQLYEESVVRWAEQQHEPLTLARWRHRRDDPPGLLRAVAERFGDAFTVWLARCAGEPAAAVIVLRHGTHAKYWRGAMNRELAHPVRANVLLHRLAIEDACASGCLVYDMGDARPGSSLADFKESFGARPVVSPAYYRERLPLTAADARLRSAVKHLVRFQDA